jgi:hypothetical protein
LSTPKTVTKGVQTVAFAGVHLLGHDQGVDHAVDEGGEGLLPCQLELFVQETNVESSVVNDDFGTLHIVQDFLRYVLELGLVAQKLIADAVNLEGVFVAVAAGVKVEMQVVAGELAIDQLDAAQLNDAVAAFSGKTCGFGV